MEVEAEESREIATRTGDGGAEAEADGEGSDLQDSAHAADQGPVGSSGGKKKKKKKKKKSSAGGGDSNGGQQQQQQKHSMTQEEKQALSKTFNDVLNAVRANDESCLWINLKECHLTDAKAKKLFAVLEKNHTVTSIDLSDNLITDAGIEALAESLLLDGSARELISLNVSHNDITANGRIVLAGLSKIRKTLKVESKTVEEEAAEQAENADLNATVKGVNPFSQQIFQNEAEEGSDGETVEHPPARELWSQTRDLLDEDKPDLQQLGAVVLEVATAIREEMNSCQLPLLPSTAKKELQPHTSYALDNLGVVGKVLLVEPPPRVSQHSPKERRPTVGSHRVAAVQLIEQLLRGRLQIIDVAIESEGLLQNVMQLVLQFPTCSALQSMGLRILNACLNSFATGLWLPLVESNDDCEAPPLQASLALGGCDMLEVPVGKRSPLAGFVIAASRMLRNIAYGVDEGDLPHFERKVDDSAPAESEVVIGEAAREELRRWLEADSSWSHFAAPNGPLDQLLAEQDQELAGPRPARYSPLEPQPSDLGRLMGNGLNSQFLYQTLQSLGGNLSFS